MNWVNKIGKGLQWILPSPFSIALLLTVGIFILALLFGQGTNQESLNLWEVFNFWETGLWNSNLLAFAVQMMLILVLGHCLALSEPIDKLIQKLLKYCTSNARAAALICLCGMLFSLFNWGLGLIFAAILARKFAEHAQKIQLKINYPLIGAAAYAGFMVWHAGISGSATTKVAESGHLKSLMAGIFTQEQIAQLPDAIDFSETVFGGMNLTLTGLCLILVPLSLFLIGKKGQQEVPTLKIKTTNSGLIEKATGMDRMDVSPFIAKAFGVCILIFCFYKAAIQPEELSLKFINPNFLNLSLLGLCLVCHKNIVSFLKGIDDAISGAAPILIQFPLYFGIMGVMKDAGLIEQVSAFFVSISGPQSYSLLTFFSAGVVNIFVPSGGGQWAVQGPLITHAAMELNIPLSRAIMALCYGDQLTNMLQPFWALPVLGITGLKAKQILPYTLLLMLIGGLIYGIGLLAFSV